MREEQMRLRAEREKERQEYERAEKERKAAEEGQQKFWLIWTSSKSLEYFKINTKITKLSW